MPLLEPMGPDSPPGQRLTLGKQAVEIVAPHKSSPDPQAPCKTCVAYLAVGAGCTCRCSAPDGAGDGGVSTSEAVLSARGTCQAQSDFLRPPGTFCDSVKPSEAQVKSVWFDEDFGI